jgi:hypothetical protein
MSRGKDLGLIWPAAESRRMGRFDGVSYDFIQ